MKMIHNFLRLAKTEGKKKCLEFAELALRECDISTFIPKKILFHEGILEILSKQIDLNQKKDLYVISIGKCGLQAAKAFQKILQRRITKGIVFDLEKESIPFFDSFKLTHPLGSKQNFQATKRLIELLKKTKKDDFILFLFSGGGSAFLTQNENPSFIEEENKIVLSLLKKNSSIQEVNTVRKHLSLARGGFLTSYSPASILALYVSDVPGNDLSWISSGPTVFDPTTKEEAKKVLEKFKIDYEKIPWIETPKNKKYFSRIENLLFLSNEKAIKACKHFAKKKEIKIVTMQFQMSVQELSKKILQDLKTALPKTLFLYGGELSLEVKGDGLGGRNTHLALTLLPFLEEGETVLALATDGIDFVSSAGALIDRDERKIAKDLNLDSEIYLKKYDSFSFFEKTKSLIETGKTGTNVGDLIFAFKG